MKRDNHSFRILVTTDNKTGRILAVSIRVRKGKASETREFGDGAAFADYDHKGDLIGIEFLEPCAIQVLNKITGSDVRTRKFVKDSIPRAMLLSGV